MSIQVEQKCIKLNHQPLYKQSKSKRKMSDDEEINSLGGSSQFSNRDRSDSGEVDLGKLFLGDAYEDIEGEGGLGGLAGVSEIAAATREAFRDSRKPQPDQTADDREETKGAADRAAVPRPQGSISNPEADDSPYAGRVTAPDDDNAEIQAIIDISEGRANAVAGGAIAGRFPLPRKRPREEAYGLGSSDEGEEHPITERKMDKLMEALTLYKVQNEDAADTRVLQFTSLFMPDSKKRRDLMEQYNKNVISPYVGIWGEGVRAEKRLLKENYKKCMAMHAHKAKHLSVNLFMEDFFYLQGYSKQGVAKKMLQNPNYKHLFGQQQNAATHPCIEKIVAKKKPARRVAQESMAAKQQPPMMMKRPSDPGQKAHLSDTPSTEANSERQFTLEACQINELESKIKKKEGGDAHEAYRSVIKQAKEKVRLTLSQKFPTAAFSAVEKQCYAFLWAMQGAQPAPSTEAMRRQAPSDYQLQEWVTKQKFLAAGIPQKRVKYWGEPRDCSSEQQLAKDRVLIKRNEWVKFCQNKQAYKQPVFALKTEDPSQSQNAGQKGKDDKTKKDVPGAPNAAALALAAGQQPQVKGILKNAEQGKPTAKEGDKHKQQNSIDQQAFEMVGNFEEYQLLKNQEQRHYSQRKKTTVTAASIMRHVRFKLGQMSDQQFYKEEYEEEVANRAGQRSQRAIQQARSNDIEFKDTETVKVQKEGPIDFEENFDVHFDKKRIEIQERILRAKEKKEKHNQQNQKPLTTTAYEPCLPKLVQPDIGKDSDDEPRRSEGNHSSQEEDDTSSSDSDSNDGDGPDLHARQEMQKRRVLPSLGDELNHAECIQDLSFYKLNWSSPDLDTFHRPDIGEYFSAHFGEYFPQTGRTVPVKVVSSKKEETEKRLNPHSYFKNRFKLSLKRGKFCVFEHIDQHPLFVNNFGMASRLKRYYYGDKQPNKRVFKSSAENVGTRHIGPFGELVLRGRGDKIDLLGQVDPKQYKGQAVLENKMYNAPVFFHKPPRTDFFCTVHKQADNATSSIFIRELDSMYTVGQVEPKLEVYNPQSRHFQNFIKQRSKSYIIRFLQESENKTINFQDITRFFPLIGEPILKKGLKEIEVIVDRDGKCKFDKKFDEEKFKDRMTPEMICQYESARHGQHRLESIGISEILSADKISYSTNKFCYEETDRTLQRVAKLIESEVLQTPWNLSSNFIKIKQETSMMMLQGQGDPSYGHGGYSFLKMPLKISADSLAGARQNRMNLNPAIQNPKAVTGTEADLRKLQKDDIFEKLLKVGVDREELEKKTRWQMVALLRWYAPNQDENKQYARGVRNTSKKQQEMYNERANQTFRKQMDNLSEYNPKYLHNLSEDEPNFRDETGIEDFASTPKKNRTPQSKGSGKHKDGDGKREPGANATDFAREIHEMMNDDSKKFMVEVKEIGEIKRLEDIGEHYLKLLLVRTPPQALAPQTSNPSGINIGGVSSNADILDAMNGHGSKDLEKILREKIASGELDKKCEILCKKIRSLTYKPEMQADGEERPKYQRIIFCADEKTIKKFNRCRNKNNGKPPRTKKARNQDRVKPRNLTADNLQRQSNQRVNRGRDSSVTGSQSRVLRTTEKDDGRSDSVYSSTRNAARGGRVVLGGSVAQSASKSKKGAKRSPNTQAGLNVNKIKITNNGQYQYPAANPSALHVSIPAGGSQLAAPSLPGQIKITAGSTPTKPPPQRRQASAANYAGAMDDEEDEPQSDSEFEPSQSGYAPPAKRQPSKVTFAQEPPVFARQKSKPGKLKKQNSTANRFKSHGFSNNDFEFSNSYQNKSQRKRQQASDQALNQIFLDIIQAMCDQDEGRYFHNPVPRQDAPNYKDLIQRPIALKDMRNKTKRNDYKNRTQFFNDVALMRQNAETFNGPAHPIAQIARDLEARAQAEVDTKQDEIVNLETLVQETTQSAALI